MKIKASMLAAALFITAPAEAATLTFDTLQFGLTLAATGPGPVTFSYSLNNVLATGGAWENIGIEFQAWYITNTGNFSPFPFQTSTLTAYFGAKSVFGGPSSATSASGGVLLNLPSDAATVQFRVSHYETFSGGGCCISYDDSFVVTGPVALITPLPAALPLFAVGLGVFGLLGWHRKRKPDTIASRYIALS
jgi:hypothetical protein